MIFSRSPHLRRPARARRAFTLAELMVAGVIAAFLVGSLTMSLAELGQTRNTSKRRFDAHLRADAALNMIRKDVISVIRSDDLFYTRLLIFDDNQPTFFGEMDRDEILVFNTRLRPVRNTDHFNGEGQEYETQYRVIEDDTGPVLWQRRDMMPDEYPRGGGVATPTIGGVIGLSFEAYDGESWNHQWDSDYDGLPHAVRITVTAAGHRNIDELFDPKTPIATLRTVVPLDRVMEPRDHAEAEEQALLDEEAAAAAENGEGGAPIVDPITGNIVDPVTGEPLAPAPPGSPNGDFVPVPGGPGGGGGGGGGGDRPGSGGTTPRPGSPAPSGGSGGGNGTVSGSGRPPTSVGSGNSNSETPVIPPE